MDAAFTYANSIVSDFPPFSSAAPLLLDAITTAATAAYSTRKLRAAYTGAALRVRESSGNTEQDIGFTAAGLLDTAALTSFVGANNGFITKWYDQSGNVRDMSQATAANQPQIVSSGVVLTQNNPAIRFSSARSSHLDSGIALSNFFNASAYTLLTGLNVDFFPVSIPSFSEHCVIFQDTAGGFAGIGAFSTTGNGFYAYDFSGGADKFAQITPVTAATNYLVIGRSDGANINAYLNGGSPVTAANGAIDNVAGTARIGCDYNTTNFLDGSMTELITFNVTLSSADLNTLGNGNIIAGGNMQSYGGAGWGTIP